MAKQVCNNCSAEVGFIQQIKMRDGNYVCRKCAKITHPLFEPVNIRTLPAFTEHLKQLEEGQVLYEKLFIPRKKPADKAMKLKKLGGGIEVAEDIGLMGMVKKRGGFLFWGGTNYYMVFRLADLFKYKYSADRTISDGKATVKHFIKLGFWETPGCDECRIELLSESAYLKAAKYFNACFGLKRDVSINAWKEQMADIKAAAKGIKTLLSGSADDGAKEEAAEQLSEAAKKQLYGDRTEWIAKADAAITKALGQQTVIPNS